MLYTTCTQKVLHKLLKAVILGITAFSGIEALSYGVESIQVHKKLRLDKRKGTNSWYARLTLPNGKRVVKSTKTDNLEEAKEIALQLYYDTQARIKNKLPASTRKFKDVAEHPIKRMQNELAEGVGKQAYKDYIQAINKWLILLISTEK